ncbi:synaptobrevin homolog YKT6 [Parasteatoda tepidariorum]|uniref:Synaptobrevin-like protein YKT6 n=1 Tax=Parasteatoda tepidariorum TaxID=114398 RepID=A0A2L2Y9M0_PARTP|nr:synaptobrevin homolog YKT6 [Parasteatoda tepidariorum]
MVKLFHLSVSYKHQTKTVTLCSTSDLTSFGYFQRNSVQEFLNFTSQILIERSQPATRTSVKEQSYMCHVYVRADRLAAALISDHEYPHRVAHTILNKVLEDFSSKVAPTAWSGDPNSVVFPALEKYLTDYQNPRNADAITKIQDELDETKIIMHNTLEAILNRGEKLDDLVSKSEQLSLQSKTFYTTARKTNSCCVIL